MTLNLSLHPQQLEVLNSPANEILYGGAAGGGKSHLMRVMAIAYCNKVKGLQVYLFRRLSDDLHKNHMEGPGGFYSLLGPLFEAGYCKFDGQKNVIKFKNGSKIWLCHCQYEKNLVKYQGPEIHVLMIDELTHFTDNMYRFLRGRCRLGSLDVPSDLKHRLPFILCGSNPGGEGHNWVKHAFVDNAAPMEAKRMPVEEGGMLRQYIPAKLADNPTLAENDPNYINMLKSLGDPILVRALMEGDWNIVAGGALDDLWNNDIHMIPRFEVPPNWPVYRALDWGSAKPFSAGWWTVAKR